MTTPQAQLDPEAFSGSRRSRLLSFAGKGHHSGRRGAVVATLSTIIVFSVLAAIVLTSPGWPKVQAAFFDWTAARDSFPTVLRAFWINIQMFLIAEVLILILALVVAVVRGLKGPVFFPLRAMAIIYTDLFRGVPLILVIYVLGFGMPALDLQGLPISPFFWGIVSLTLVYTAYVAEVYRAGIESVHPSQMAAARSLGLSRWQGLRFVVLPQAVRRVIPPLLNDFIGLQKDTALVAVLGVVETVRAAGIYAADTFNYTSYVVAAALFLLLTIPMARFTDHLIERGRRRRMAGGGR